MKPIIYAVIGVIFFGLINTIIEQKLSKIHGVTMAFCYITVTWVIFLVLKQLHPPVSEGISTTIPKDTPTWMWLIAVGIGIVLADYFFLGAYNLNGNVMAITSILILMPLISSVFRLFWVRQMPNIYIIGGFILAAGAVVLIAIGNNKLSN